VTTYQLFPNLTADEYDALAADIRNRGVMVPVEKDETGAILDGHHRAMIADSLGIDYPTIVRGGWTEDQKLVHVVALNAHRRHLTPVERAEVVATLRKAKLSTRAIAKAVGVDHSTVVRDLAAGASAPPDAITGADGKSYPASRLSLADDVERIAALPALAASNERVRWSGLLLGSARVLTEATPDYWADRLTEAQAASLHSHLSVLRTWIDDWERALARPALRPVGGSR
jgi:ParB-like chromosome segregation protein Spo0J